jgi:hypothetical protein
MKNFQLIAQGIHVMPLALALHTHEHLWNQHALRTATPGSPHREIDDIWLRMNDLSKCRQADVDPGPIVDHRECINYPAFQELPEARALVQMLAATVSCSRIGRCLVSRLAPGKAILPHKDIGDDLSIYYDNEAYYSRFHIVIQGYPGSTFRCEDETVTMQTGEIWWFRNDLDHEVINNSRDDRIHLVADIRTLK